MSEEMKAGTVKFFNTTKGFGFVTALQRSGIQGLNEGDKVMFDTAVNERTGKTAVENISMA